MPFSHALKRILSERNQTNPIFGLDTASVSVWKKVYFWKKSQKNH